MIRGLACAVVGILALIPPGEAQERRDRLVVPGPTGFEVLTADLHLHSVFSDGEVWPTVHVREAWRDGLDVVSLTEHREYRPHARDLTGGTLRAYELAKPLAEQLGILLVPGVEITRPVPGQASPWPVGSAHFNALFISDEEPLGIPDLATALGHARSQGGFVSWNHPQFMGRAAEWYPHVGQLFDQRLFAGIEVVNGDEYSPEAFTWALQRRLTILACSDAHLPMPAHLRSSRRPVTLLFARGRDLGAVREALVERRTAAWLDDDVWGEEQWLRAIWDGAVQVSVAAGPPQWRVGADFAIALENSSAIDFDVEVESAPAWLRVSQVRLPRSATALLRGRVLETAPAGLQQVALGVRVRNLHVRPDAQLRGTLSLRAVVSR
jgi:3',5'-nucleoside bisphosphate phosphatase